MLVYPIVAAGAYPVSRQMCQPNAQSASTSRPLCLASVYFLRFVVHSDTETAESEAAHNNMNAIFGHAICRAAYCYWAWRYRYGLPMNGCSLCGNDEPVSWFDLDSLLENVQSRG